MVTTIRRTGLCAALLLALAAALAATVHAKRDEESRYEVRVTASYQADWLQRSATYGERCRGWSEGDGSLRGRIRTTDPITLEIEPAGRRGRWWGDEDYAEDGRYQGSFATHYAVKVHPVAFQTAECSPCGPLSELGECEPAPRDYDLQGGCKERRATGFVGAGVGPKGGGAANVGISVSKPIERCRWPTQVLDGSPPVEIENFRFTWGNVAPRLVKLDVGDKLTVRDRASEGRDCGKMNRRSGFRLCARYEMEVEFRRVVAR